MLFYIFININSQVSDPGPQGPLVSNSTLLKNLSVISSVCHTDWIKIRARHFVGPDLDPNCVQRLSVEDTDSVF